jgi:hypothetical protein
MNRSASFGTRRPSRHALSASSAYAACWRRARASKIAYDAAVLSVYLGEVMSPIGKWLSALVGCVLVLGIPLVAVADVLADTCLDYTNSSEMLKQAPAASRSKWCACIGEKVPAADHRSVADIMKLQKVSEAKGQAFGENDVPKPMADGFTRYFDAQGACLSVMLGGAGPSGGASVPAAAAPPLLPASRPNGSTFRLNNSTGLAISELYVSPAKSKTWGKDILGDHTIEDGEAWKISLPPSKNPCLQDLRVVFADNSEAVWERFDLCEVTKINLTYNRRTGVTTATTD